MAILDIAMPRLNGIDVAERAIKHQPQLKVVFLSMYADESYVLRALSAGARGYLLKESTEQDLVPALRTISQGRPYFSPTISAMLLSDYMRHLQQRGQEDSYRLLTDREKEVLQLLAEGRTNKEVASMLEVGRVDGRNASRQPDAEARAAQHGGDRPLCRAQEPGVVGRFVGSWGSLVRKVRGVRSRDEPRHANLTKPG